MQTARPWIPSNQPVKCEVDWMNHSQDMWITDKQTDIQRFLVIIRCIYSKKCVLYDLLDFTAETSHHTVFQLTVMSRLHDKALLRKHSSFCSGFCQVYLLFSCKWLLPDGSNNTIAVEQLEIPLSCISFTSKCRQQDRLNWHNVSTSGFFSTLYSLSFF